MSDKSDKSNKPTENKDAGDSMSFLEMYNVFSACAWGRILIGVLTVFPIVGQPFFFEKTNSTLITVQSTAIIEIFNSAMGFVKAPLFTTVAQVASRLLLVFGIMKALPNSPANFHWSYVTLSICWSVTEIVRYGYYYKNLSTKGNPPKILTLLRYNLFFVLYPCGVASELIMIYLSLDEAAASIGIWYKWFLVVCMATYAPGFYILFTHMIKQRSKVMKTLKTKKE